MRICLVSSSFYPATLYGGPISATWDLSRELAKKGVEMYVSTTNANKNSRLNVKPNVFFEKEPGLFIKYYHEELINRFSSSFIMGIWNDIKKADVIYIQYLFHYTVFFSLLFSFIQRKKIIVCPRGSFSLFTLSNSYSFLKLLWINLFVRLFYKSIIWQASSFLEEHDIKRVFPKSRIVIINDGVDFMSFQGFKSCKKHILLEKYTKRKFKDISKIFFSMGRLHSIKCFDVLIDAFALFVNQHKNAKLIIAGGDDGVEKQLMEQISNYKLSNSVFLIGSIDFMQKKEILNNCDYFTLSSSFESFGIVVAEALSCGKPVVLSNKTPWINLETNKCGILVDNNKISFYNAFLKIVNQKYDGAGIKDYVKSNYDLGVISDRFLSVVK